MERNKDGVMGYNGREGEEGRAYPIFLPWAGAYSHGRYSDIYTLTKSGQVNILWSNNDVRMVTELIPQ